MLEPVVLEVVLLLLMLPRVEPRVRGMSKNLPCMPLRKVRHLTPCFSSSSPSLQACTCRAGAAAREELEGTAVGSGVGVAQRKKLHLYDPCPCVDGRTPQPQNSRPWLGPAFFTVSKRQG